MSSKDDDVAVIALWIIAIGFFILAVDKTTRLGKNTRPSLTVPITVEKCPPQNQEDKQFEQIQQQLRQLKDGLENIKKICKTENRNKDRRSISNIDTSISNIDKSISNIDTSNRENHEE
ncbi:hypothetical protein [Brevibacillus sp. SYP-B805]|uniref:hypothetical protein n=1 Tax=Brevibacillus sp. SYP-B805 TaxID=1578199 RepID=UPI0019D1B0F0|nr:hypothetical protein [Brevibacillus sp. SYP-B805]